MQYVKKYATDEERNLAKSIAGKKGAAKRIALGHNKGGRPKGSRNKTSSSVEPTRTMTVRESSYKTFSRCAGFINKSLVEFMSIVADGLKKKNPQLFELQDQVRV